MDRKIRVAAIGDNCIDYYDSLNESYPGGNPVNVAVYIKRLGGESSYTGAVGTDSFGKIMISAIQNKGVDTSHIQVLDGKTAVTHVDIVDGDRVFGKYEEGVLADFKLREQDISFIKKHDLAVTGIWGMIEDDLPLISKEIPVAFDFANKFANPIVEKAIPYVTYAFFSFDEESRNEFRQKYHSMGLKEKENCMEQLKEFMKAMQQKGPKVIIATLGKNGSIGYDGNSWYRFGIIECKVVDTMGAGDSFIAGFLYGILNGLNVQDSMVMSIAACGNQSESNKEAKKDDNTITVWCWDKTFNIFAMEEAAKIYQEDHQDVKIDIVEVGDVDVQSRLTTAGTSGDLSTLPDIFLMQDHAFQKNVISYPDVFTEISEKKIDFSEFASGKTDFSVVDGKHYGVPFDNGAAIACYRTDILQEAGMTLEDFTDITWDEWVEKGKVVLEKTGKPLLTTTAGECDLLTMMLQSAGASLFNEDGTTNIAKNDTLKKVIDTYCKMKDSGVLQEVNNWDEYTGSMVNNEVAGVINGCWIMGTIQTAEDQSGKWAITNIPKLTNVKGATNYSNNGGSSWAISGNCGNVELAEDFLASTFAGSTELYNNILSCGAIATWTPAGDSDAYAVPNEFFSGDAVFEKIVDYSTKVPSIITGPYFHEAELKKTEDTVNFNMGQ